jgi:hypothetical protein
LALGFYTGIGTLPFLRSPPLSSGILKKGLKSSLRWVGWWSVKRRAGIFSLFLFRLEKENELKIALTSYFMSNEIVAFLKK